MTERSASTPLRGDTAGVLVGLGVWAVILAALAVRLGWFGLGEADLEVVASIQPSPGDTAYTVDGRVLYDGDFPAGVRVWAVAESRRGEGFATDPQTTDAGGHFRLGPIPLRPDTMRGLSEVTVHARMVLDTARVRRFWLDRREEVRLAETTLALGHGSNRILAVPRPAFLTVVGLFFVSILLAIIPWRPSPRMQAFKYLSAVVLAFVFSFVVLYYMSTGLAKLSELGARLPTQGEEISLGFASVFRGTYVASVPEEWVFSLTSPAVGADGLVHGFGAPLWVLLLAVLGAGVFTISIIVEGIRDPLVDRRTKVVRAKVQLIVLHEFYVLFAPLGAVFAYQAAVAAGAAGQPLTVGSAVLVAGLGLNVVLNKGIERFGALMGVHQTATALAGEPTAETPEAAAAAAGAAPADGTEGGDGAADADA